MPMFKALKLCPQAVVIKPDFAKYRAESARIMAKLSALTPLVQPLSLDEAWLDLSGCERLHGAPAAVVLARVQPRDRARDRHHRLGGPVGQQVPGQDRLGPGQAARLFGDRAAEAQAFLAPRPVGILPGVGPAIGPRAGSRGLQNGGRFGAGRSQGPGRTFRRLRPAPVPAGARPGCARRRSRPDPQGHQRGDDLRGGSRGPAGAGGSSVAPVRAGGARLPQGGRGRPGGGAQAQDTGLSL